MPKIIFVEADGTEHRVDAPLNETVMQVATSNMIPGILADCGGSCTCATCHCYVDARWSDKIPAASEDEKDMLEGAIDPDDTSRLTCQIHITEELEGAIFKIPESQY